MQFIIVLLIYKDKNVNSNNMPHCTPKIEKKIKIKMSNIQTNITRFFIKKKLRMQLSTILHTKMILNLLVRKNYN